ncbi:alpha/beta fold hydrolase [Streptomyces sp. NPDC021093]|uniref:alpha/beta fold hydrolase n=1 Tax=Streptomyces sp. NPDC021093 TaxID=3365112 RepID=UPI00379F3130
MSETVRPDGARIHYEVHGEGFPVLLLAPGGVSGRSASWGDDLYDPVGELSRHFKVIAVDQRHTGRSSAPAAPFSYEESAADHLAVLDEVGAARAHVVAAEFGCAQAWRLARTAPDRVCSVVAQEPAGRDTTNTLGDFFTPFDEAMRLPRAAGLDDPETEGLGAVFEAAATNGVFAANPQAGPFAQRLHDDAQFRADVLALRREKYITLLVRFRDALLPEGHRLFSVPDEWITECAAPLLVLPGRAPCQPEGVARWIAERAPSATLLDAGFDEPARRAQTVTSIVEFLLKNTPS